MTASALLRSQDSLSLMHHASTAGSRTPTPPKSHSARWRSSGQSPTDNRQALVEIDLNQQPTQAGFQSGFQTGLVSRLTVQQTQQPVEQKVQERERQEQQLHQEPTPEQQPSMQHRGSKASRQSKQLRWADTARQLDQQLLQGSQQPAASSPSAASSGNAASITADPGSNRVSEQNCHGAAIMDQDQSTHLEELCALTQSPEPTRIAQPQQLQSLAYIRTAQSVRPSSAWQGPWSYDPHPMADIAGSCGGSHTPGYKQYGSERREHMHPPHSVTGLAHANHHASECQQHALQQTFVAACYGSLAVTGSMHHQPGVHIIEGSDLPAGIPLTLTQASSHSPGTVLKPASGSFLEAEGSMQRCGCHDQDGSSEWTSVCSTA